MKQTKTRTKPALKLEALRGEAILAKIDQKERAIDSISTEPVLPIIDGQLAGAVRTLCLLWGKSPETFVRESVEDALAMHLRELPEDLRNRIAG